MPVRRGKPQYPFIPFPPGRDPTGRRDLPVQILQPCRMRLPPSR